MSRIRSKDSAPEMMVRRLVHHMGFRYRLHVRDLPGCPDLVFPKRRRIVFVNGCFWHQHEGCSLSRLPHSNLQYWIPKLERNKMRDKENVSILTAQGWNVLTIHECEVADQHMLKRRLQRFLK